MLDLYIDGDACPVRGEIVRVATRHGLQIYLVSNQGMRTMPGALITAIVVGSDFDAADHWIADHIAPDDIVVTADIQLAARCLAKGSVAINPNGKLFTTENIGPALAMRELNAYLRDSGALAGSNPSFSKSDRSRFLQTLDTLIEQTKRKVRVVQASRTRPPSST